MFAVLFVRTVHVNSVSCIEFFPVVFFCCCFCLFVVLKSSVHLCSFLFAILSYFLLAWNITFSHRRALAASNRWTVVFLWLQMYVCLGAGHSHVVAVSVGSLVGYLLFKFVAVCRHYRSAAPTSMERR